MYKTAARAAEKKLEWEKAAKLWQAAINHYPYTPVKGGWAEADLNLMKVNMQSCKAMVR